MSTNDTGALQTSAHDSEEQKRTRRALTECMTALEIAPGLYTVIGQHSGPEYTVDTIDGRCTCPDTQYNLESEEACKHELRVNYATRELEIPDWIQEDNVDPLLGEHVQPAVTDGGTTATPEPDTTEDDDLELVDTGAGSLVFEQLVEERDGATVTTGKRLLGYYSVDDWDAIEDAIQARGYGPGAVLNLPEFETVEDAHEAAMDAGGA